MKKLTAILLIFGATLFVACNNNTGNQSGSSSIAENPVEEVPINPRDYVSVKAEYGHFWLSLHVKNTSNQKVKKVIVKYRINNGSVKSETFTNIAPNETKSANIKQTMGSDNYALTFDDVHVTL